MIITVDILKSIAPGSKRTNYKLLPDLAHWMNIWFPKYEIDSKGELRHFISQAAHETDSFNSLEEYATGDAYDTRVDLGNTPAIDGDGRKYKGRGIFQTTGKSNYKILDIKWEEQNPDDNISFSSYPANLLLPKYAVWSACEFWEQKGFNTYANMSENALIWSKKHNKNLVPIEYMTWRINGSIKTVPERKKFYERAKQIIQ